MSGYLDCRAMKRNVCRFLDYVITHCLAAVSLQELRIAYALAEQEVEGGLSARISPLAQVCCGLGLSVVAALVVSLSSDVNTVQIFQGLFQLFGLC